MDLALLSTHFPKLTEHQLELFRRHAELFLNWNSKINMVSRKDTEHFLERHVLHSLGIAKVMSFTPGTSVLDIGTGGGFPGIPLAILFPETKFTLCDSIGKKIMVVNELKSELGLENVTAVNSRAEQVRGQFDFIVSRAVTALPNFMPWTKGKIRKQQQNALPNGILYLKGGDLKDELKGLNRDYEIFDLHKHFPYPFFETKKVVYIKMV